MSSQFASEREEIIRETQALAQEVARLKDEHSADLAQLARERDALAQQREELLALPKLRPVNPPPPRLLSSE